MLSFFHPTGPTDLIHSSPASHFKTFLLFRICFSEVSKFYHHSKLSSKHNIVLVATLHCYQFLLNLSSSSWCAVLNQRVFLLNSAVPMAVVDLISRIHLASHCASSRKVALSIPRWCHWNFSSTWSFGPHCGPGVDSASNRIEYQEYFLWGRDGQWVGLTTLPPSCADCLEIWEPQHLWNPQGLSRPVMGLLYLYLLYTSCIICYQAT